MANFCKSCGKELEPNIKFCSSCGAQTDAAAGAPPIGGQQAAGDPGQGRQAAGASAGGQQGQQAVEKVMEIARNTKEYTDEMDAADIEKNKMICCFTYFIFFLPFLACPDSKFGRYHANQSLALLIVFVAAWIVTSVLRMIFPFFLYWLVNLVSFIIYLPVLAVLIMAIINTYAGKAKDLPFVGTIRIIK